MDEQKVDRIIIVTHKRRKFRIDLTDSEMKVTTSWLWFWTREATMEEKDQIARVCARILLIQWPWAMDEAFQGKVVALNRNFS